MPDGNASSFKDQSNVSQLLTLMPDGAVMIFRVRILL
jgi:hypothetical protein